MYEFSKSAALLDGEQSEVFHVEQGVAQGCSLSPILFSVFINGLLTEVEEAGIRIDFSGGRLGGLLFADDFIGVSAVMVFARESVDGGSIFFLEYLNTHTWVLINPRRACAARITVLGS